MMTLKQKLLAALTMLGIVLGALIAGFSWSATASRAALHTVLADRVIPLKDLKLVADNYAVRITDAAHKARNGNISFARAAADIGKGKADVDAAWKRYAATDATDGLARQNGTAKVPHLDQHDEIGDIARSVDAFLEAVIAKERDAAAAAAETQRIVTTALEQGLSALADGDLTGEIHAEFPESYAALKANFNSALAALRVLIATVSEGATAIQTGSREIAQASEDLARRTEGNAASIEETSAALAQMDERLRGTAEAANQTVRSADDAIRVVGDGRALAEQAVTAMGRVSESARGIDDVIEGLDKIAFQTRVLAMNAAVEAGRAGEAGRGFAVVADLVSALAMRAEEEAKRAREQLTLTQDEVGTAVGAVQRMDSALEAISGGVGAVHRLLDAMAADNQAQSTAITQIVTAVNEMDQSTQQNAAMVEETSAASRNLAEEVGNLADQAGRFRTGGAAGTARRGRVVELRGVAA